jgi:hypothetical protein
MIKAGLILLGAIVVLNVIGLIPVPFLSCCLSILGLAAAVGGGYLAGQFDHPATGGLSARGGAVAGAIGGVGALVVQVLSGAYSAFTLGPEGSVAILQQLGWDVGNADISPAMFYTTAIGTSCCVGLIAVALLAGLGALGGLIWYQTKGKTAVTQIPM